MTTRILQNSADGLRWLFFCGIRGIAGAALPSISTSTRITEPLQSFLAHEQSSSAEQSFTDPSACERELLHRQFRAFVRSCLPNEAFVAALVGPECCLPYLQVQCRATITCVAEQMQASWLPALQALASVLTQDRSASLRQALVDSGALVRLLVMLGDLSHIDATDDTNAIGDEFRTLKAEYERLRRELEQQTYRPSTTSSSSLWASGTGYGFGDDEDDEYDEYDDEDGYPRPRRNDDHAASGSSKPVDQDQESRMQVLTALLEVLASWFGGAPMTEAAVASVASLLDASSLIPLFVSRFRNYSMLDMAEQLALYTALFRTMSALLQQHVWHHGQARMPELVAAVDSLRARALQVRKSATKIRTNDTMDVEDVVQSLVHLIIASHENLEPYLATLRSAPARACNDDASVPQQDSAVPLDGAMHYIEQLRELQCLEHDILSQQQEQQPHSYVQKAQADGIGGALKLRRLMSELASLGTNLPLHPESSVFFRFDSERPDVCTALITGPAATPYDGGCFHFDIYLPSSYPNSPPVVNLRTTGHGSVRFNPNLYEQGTVCLSLLGTWSGASGENWSAESSTLLQVLVSIQSLILVEQPYFNEPGYESSMHTAAGEAASTNYNRTIREATVRWAMIDQLRNPAPGYEQVIRTHFGLHGRHCVQVVGSWIAEAAETPTHKSSLEQLLGELQAELQKL